MPHVIVKLYPGRSEELKARLAEEVAKTVMNNLNFREDSVSAAVEEVEQQDWAEKVYRPGILDHPEKIYKKPEYNPFELRGNFPATEFRVLHQK